MTQHQKEGESCKAYKAYETYRDMGASRTILWSYALYLIAMGKDDNPYSTQKVPSPSPNYKSWVADYGWLDRVVAYDRERAERVQQALLDKDTAAYIARVEKLRVDLDDFSTEILSAGRLSISIATIRLGGILDRVTLSAAYSPLDKPTLDEYSSMNRGLVQATSVMALAYQKVVESLGLEKVIEKINEMEKEN